MNLALDVHRCLARPGHHQARRKLCRGPSSSLPRRGRESQAKPTREGANPLFLLNNSRGWCTVLLDSKACEKGPYSLHSHVGGTGHVVEQDEPFDPLNIGRHRPGTAMTGTHAHFTCLN